MVKPKQQAKAAAGKAQAQQEPEKPKMGAPLAPKDPQTLKAVEIEGELPSTPLSMQSTPPQVEAVSVASPASRPPPSPGPTSADTPADSTLSTAAFTAHIQELRGKLSSVVQAVKDVAQSLDEPHSIITSVRDQLHASTRESASQLPSLRSSVYGESINGMAASVDTSTMPYRSASTAGAYDSMAQGSVDGRSVVSAGVSLPGSGELRRLSSANSTQSAAAIAGMQLPGSPCTSASQIEAFGSSSLLLPPDDGVHQEQHSALAASAGAGGSAQVPPPSTLEHAVRAAVMRSLPQLLASGSLHAPSTSRRSLARTSVGECSEEDAGVQGALLAPTSTPPLGLAAGMDSKSSLPDGHTPANTPGTGVTPLGTHSSPTPDVGATPRRSTEQSHSGVLLCGAMDGEDPCLAQGQQGHVERLRASLDAAMVSRDTHVLHSPAGMKTQQQLEVGGTLSPTRPMGHGLRDPEALVSTLTDHIIRELQGHPRHAAGSSRDAGAGLASTAATADSEGTTLEGSGSCSLSHSGSGTHSRQAFGRTNSATRSPVMGAGSSGGGAAAAAGGDAASGGSVSGGGAVSGEAKEAFGDMLLQYWALRERVGLQDREIKASNASLVARESALASARAELAARAAEVDSLRSELQTLQKHTDTALQGQASSFHGLQAAGSDLQLLRTELEAARTALEAKGAELDAAHAELADRDASLAAYTAAMSASEVALQGMRTEMASKDQRLAAAETELAAKRTALLDQAEELAKTIEALQRKETEQAALVIAQVSAAAEAETMLNALRTQMSMVHAELAYHETERVSVQEAAAGKEAALASAKESLLATQAALAAKDSELMAVQRVLADREQQYSSMHTGVSVCEQQLSLVHSDSMHQMKELVQAQAAAANKSSMYASLQCALEEVQGQLAAAQEQAQAAQAALVNKDALLQAQARMLQGQQAAAAVAGLDGAMLTGSHVRIKATGHAHAQLQGSGPSEVFVPSSPEAKPRSLTAKGTEKGKDAAAVLGSPAAKIGATKDAAPEQVIAGEAEPAADTQHASQASGKRADGTAAAGSWHAGMRQWLHKRACAVSGAVRGQGKVLQQCADAMQDAIRAQGKVLALAAAGVAVAAAVAVPMGLATSGAARRRRSKRQGKQTLASGAELVIQAAAPVAPAPASAADASVRPATKQAISSVPAEERKHDAARRAQKEERERGNQAQKKQKEQKSAAATAAAGSSGKNTSIANNASGSSAAVLQQLQTALDKASQALSAATAAPAGSSSASGRAGGMSSRSAFEDVPMPPPFSAFSGPVNRAAFDEGVLARCVRRSQG